VQTPRAPGRQLQRVTALRGVGARRGGGRAGQPDAARTPRGCVHR
jgi:hypothetical protein